jgi:hypothetical protein
MIFRGSRPLATLVSVVALTCIAQAGPIQPSSAEASRIGHKVWQNECAGTVEGLVSWNSGEAFPSLGIGHFIWYPEGKRGPFEESFPKLVSLLKERGTKVPNWLSASCPWQTRAAMQKDTARVHELRSLLANTIAIQTEFLIQRLEGALPKMEEAVSAAQRSLVRKRFEAVGNAPGGAFALIDYVNFKGEGVLETERYKGQGWGLLQVLLEMKGKGDPVRDFADAASRVLARRVHNAPAERHEERWLSGWQSRVQRY